MNKPLYKDPSFWIVALTLIGAANLAQFYYGVPWLKQRVAASRPAPRMTNDAPSGPMNAVMTRPDLDYSKKTYSWQRPQFDPNLLQETPPQVVLIPSEYKTPSGGWRMFNANNTIGIRISAPLVVQSAYNWNSSSRLIMAADLPPGEFDFIANLPTGALEALQAEIKKQWGVVAEREMHPTNVLVMIPNRTNAPAATRSAASPPIDAGGQNIRFGSMSSLAMFLESRLRQPLIDQSGLTFAEGIQIPANLISGGPNNDAVEQVRKMLLERLGIDLVQTNTQVEMLVIKKVSGGNP